MANFQSYDRGTAIKILRHDFRENGTYRNEKVDLERSNENKVIYGAQTYREAKERLDWALKEIPHANRKDLQVTVNYVITMPETILNEEQERIFWETAKQQLIDHFGKSRIITIVVHNDEEKKHMHAVLLPVVKTDRNEKGLKICSKEFLTRKLLKQWHSDLQQRIEKQEKLKWVKAYFYEKPKVEKWLQTGRDERK